MKAEQGDKALHQKFVTEAERLVFWHNPNGKFADYVTGGLGEQLADVLELPPSHFDRGLSAGRIGSDWRNL